MDDFRDVFPKRLMELFGDMTQDELSEHYHVSQTAVSRWKTGKNFPNADTLHQIATEHNVSIDWLLGFSDKRNRDDAFDETELTYEHAIKILDMFLGKGIIVIPDLNSFTDEVVSEEPELESDEEDPSPPPPREPRLDSDVLLVTDRALSYLLRRRLKLMAVGEDAYEYWKEHWDVFGGISLLDYSGSMKEAMDTLPLAEYTKDGDWARLLREMSPLTEENLKDMIAKHKEKEGKENGREEHS